MCHHDFHRTTVQVVEVLLQPFHVVRHHHLREVVANHHILVMLRCGVATYIRSAEESLKLSRQGAVIIMCQGRHQKALAETAGTQKNGSFVKLQTGDIVCLIDIIEPTVAHFSKIRHRIRDSYTYLIVHIHHCLCYTHKSTKVFCISLFTYRYNFLPILTSHLVIWR